MRLKISGSDKRRINYHMPEISSSNIRIAKNTAFLYARLLLLLVISLYTSRVVLQVLGVDDYGIYNVVGGVVVMFSFINGALTTSTQRHLSFERGKEDGSLARIFSACLNIHLLFGLIIVVLAETVGLWFVNTQMNFPEGKLPAVNWVYQFAIFTSFFNVVRTPYEASVIAYERMSFYAYIGILEAILKLLSVFLLKVLLFDKLIAFSALHLLVAGLIFGAFAFFSHSRLPDIRIIKVADKSLYKYLFSFSGWTLLGSLATLMETQGLNILINIFWGVAVNAAVGIASQVRGALAQFVAGFQQALNPQLVMSQSSGQKERQSDLIIKSSKFSFFILYILALPLCVNLPYVLDLWLDIVPTYTAQICYLIIFVQIVECLASPLYTTIFAIGSIKSYQIAVCVLRSCSLLLGFILCKLGVAPYLVFTGPCVIAIILLLYRLFFVSHKISFSIREFFTKTLTPVTLVTVLSAVPILVYKSFISYQLSFWILVLETAFFVIYISMLVYYVGLSKGERYRINSVIHSKLGR